jgi:alanyl aminopeptidase
MFEQYLGEDVFQRGVRLYLSRHAGKTATAADFLSALGEAAGRDVGAAFNTFLQQPGAPLVTAQLSCQSEPSVRLTQQRFVTAGVTAAPELWQVPVCLRWPGGQTCVLLDAAEKVVSLTPSGAEGPSSTLDAGAGLPGSQVAGPSTSLGVNGAGCPAWVLPNAGAAGYFRARPVDPKLLGEAQVSVTEKVGASGDLAALVHTGAASVADQLALVPRQLASGNRQLTQYATWPFLELDQHLPPASQKKLSALAQRSFGPRARALGFAPKPGEPEEDALLRPSLLAIAGGVGEDQALRAQATKLSWAWLKARSALSPELVSVALQLAAEQNDPALFEALSGAAQREPERKTRRQLLKALGGFRARALVLKAQALVLAPALEASETQSILWEQVSDPRSAPPVWDFVTTHYDELVKRLPEDHEAALVNFGTAFCTKDKRAAIEAFFEPRTTRAPGGPREYANAMEELDQCLAWREQQIPAAVAWLETLR